MLPNTCCGKPPSILLKALNHGPTVQPVKQSSCHASTHLSYVPPKEQQQNIVGQTLLAHGRKSNAGSLCARLAVLQNCSRPFVDRLLQAMAEMCAKRQEEVLSSVLQYVKLQSQAGECEPLAFYFFSSYDETPLKVRISWSAGEAATTQTGKLYTVMNCWAALLRVTRELVGEKLPTCQSARHVILKGSFSPSVRPTDATTGEAVATVLSENSGFPPREAQAIFRRTVRMVEYDDAKANAKGERLLAAKHPNWTRGCLVCTAHKVHGGMAKTFSLFQSQVTSGIARVFLSVQGSSVISMLGRLLPVMVPGRGCGATHSVDTCCHSLSQELPRSLSPSR